MLRSQQSCANSGTRLNKQSTWLASNHGPFRNYLLAIRKEDSKVCNNGAIQSNWHVLCECTGVKSIIDRSVIYNLDQWILTNDYKLNEYHKESTHIIINRKIKN